MKHPIIPSALAAILLSACQQVDIESMTESKQQKDVQFVFAGITESYSTRATVQSVGMTDIWVYEGTTLLKHQTSTDSDFGIPSVMLTYGSHDLTFVASKADGQTFSSVWSCTKVKDTFSKTMNVTVSGSSSNSRQVQLSRRSSQVCFKIEDAIPTDVKTMHITADNHLSLSADLAAGTASTFETTTDITSYQGRSVFQPVINLLTASATDEEDCDVMIEFLDEGGTALYHYDRTVKLKPNRCTTLSGSYFSGGGMSLSVDDTWLDELEVPLFDD